MKRTTSSGRFFARFGKPFSPHSIVGQSRRLSRQWTTHIDEMHSTARAIALYEVNSFEPEMKQMAG